jgi:hypothetical protein
MVLTGRKIFDLFFLLKGYIEVIYVSGGEKMGITKQFTGFYIGWNMLIRWIYLFLKG